MSLLQDYSNHFKPDVLKRGEQYQKDGAVEILDHGQDYVAADVTGSELYNVSIGLDPNLGATFDCTCAYFEEYGPCKHCWAAVLEAFQQGVLPGMNPESDEPAPAAGKLRRVGADGADTDDDGTENDGDGESNRSESDDPNDPRQRLQRELGGFLGGVSPGDLLRTLRPAKGGIRAETTGVKPSDDAWKNQLKRLSDSMAARPTLAPKPLNWPKGRRILYVIDEAATLDSGLTLVLMHETPKREGVYEQPRGLRLTQFQIPQLPDPVDRQIIQLLNGAARSGFGYYHYDSPLPEKCEIDEAATEDILRQICATGRCRLMGDDLFQPVVWDDGPAWEFCLQLKPSPGGRYLILDGSLRRAKPVQAKPTFEAPDHAEETEEADEAVDPVDPEMEAATHPDVLPTPNAVATEALPTAIAPAAESSAAEAPAEPTPAQPDFESVPLSEPHLLLHGISDGFVFVGQTAARLRHFDAFPLISALRAGEKISIPLDKQTELLKMLLKFPRLPRLELPAELDIAELAPIPRPKMKLSSPGRSANMSGGRDSLIAKVQFDYGGLIVDRADKQAAVVTEDGRKLVRRDAQREAAHFAELQSLGFREEGAYWNEKRDLRLPSAKLPRAVGELTRKGWIVEADGKLYRSAGQVTVSVSSGIDWFELHGQVSFDGITASLPRLLDAMRKGENVVRLDDGTFGLLPEDWLRKYGGLAGLGEAEGDTLKFSHRQVGFLDALLTSMPEAKFDETFGRIRDALMRFAGVEADRPAGHVRRHTPRVPDRGPRLDGVPAAVRLRRLPGRRHGPWQNRPGAGAAGRSPPTAGRGSAGRRGECPSQRATRRGDGNQGSRSAAARAVPGRGAASLVFNWKQEALKFSPQLRVLDHTSVDRIRSSDHFKEYDLVITTYGTLRRDMSYFKDIRFDYAILDEAQAIKNAASESAKAARLINADHRLALSGTPVQNHLGELWSLFDYLNPGMMGSLGVFRDLSADAANKDATSRELLARSLRPFILRRTKEQVAKDLPEKLEQTIYCELEKEQRKLYDELRDHYRTSLLERVAREGMNKAKIMVLEALLRLRQAACHPGLIDKTRSDQPSAKLEALMEHLDDVVAEGHKVLVFSQFTSMLAIVKERLDKDKTVYEYLDGRTKDRQARVERFQSDPDCKLFLISLKAGGVGLNLTAAEYVFLLDPWWNPAVEAQAIDRAHRIGQTQRVFAYRLIAKDTVEEKVLQLQQSKKDLADAIINADNSLIRGLSRDDLEMLLS